MGISTSSALPGQPQVSGTAALLQAFWVQSAVRSVATCLRIWFVEFRVQDSEERALEA